MGAVIDETLNEEIRITVIATGFESENNRLSLGSIVEESKKVQPQVKEVAKEQQEVAVDAKEPEMTSNNYEPDDLDIPVFLRRQKRH